MKKGDVIGGYVLTTDVREGGGHSQWAFARKGGTEFFLKRFLAPVYPVAGSPGSEATKAAKRARCEDFERHHRLVTSKLKPISGEGGNLVIAKDFFRDNTHYYKVTSKVDVSAIGPKNISALPRADRILIMLTASHSLDTLHKAGLVHGDVKPENLLVKALDKGFAIKVIDFDNCFVVRNPPVPDQLVGDPAYYSPELLRYVVGKSAGNKLDEKNDVFALGLVFWQYLAGQRPRLPDGIPYAAEAVEKGATLSLPKSVKDRPLAELITSMLAKAPAERPSMGEVHGALKLARRTTPDGPARSAAAAAEPIIRGLRGKMFGRGRGPGDLPVAGFAGPSAAEPAAPAPPREAPPGEARPSGAPPSEAPPGKLRGKLIAKAGASEEASSEPGEGRLRGSLIKRKE